MSNLVPPAVLQNIAVTVRPDEKHPGKFISHTVPADPILTEPNVILNYQIVESFGLDIVFTGAVVKPRYNRQVSKPTISVDGKMLTLSDINTEKMTLNITLEFDGPSGPFAHDPQVQNDPQKPPMC
ncbi:hypothetical protein GTP38_08505 [Duganella sp. FT94W]|uniref:Uncharacterized protein n=1 Tax=Duganella lactea TaxID=2692173 RepID=A0ABW9V3U9_9BURK|nr:hypothetical protein [Duganella lactea]MYM34376.1 hypothetical protein [Duganella lactea]